MKRKIPVLIALVLFIMVGILTACAPQQLDRLEGKVKKHLDAAEDAFSNALQDAIPTLTADEAKTIAIEHADLIGKQVSRLRAEYDLDDGIPQYNVEFHYDGFEYNYEIHAQTGQILSFEKER